MQAITKKKETDQRKKLSIELCENFTRRLHPSQSKELKTGALIAIKNFIKETKIDDDILLSFLVDSITDPDKEIRKLVSSIIKEVVNNEIIELLEIKLNESNGSEIKEEIQKVLIDSVTSG